MAKSLKGAAATKLIEDVITAPGVFVYAELMDLPGIKSLAGTQYDSYLELLQIFSYGTYGDYKAKHSSLPKLNENQLIKLKQLSMVSLANETRILPYSRLLTILDLPTIRALEDLIIDAIYAGIVSGKLDQKFSQFQVHSTMGRDLRPGQLEELLGALQDWSNRTKEVLDSLDSAIAEAVANAAQKTENQKEWETVRQATVTELVTAKTGIPKGRREEAMDVDIVPSASSSGVHSRRKPTAVETGSSAASNARKRHRGGP
ncbi:uncharacterized protein EI90DRAFT_3063226 [Cantharellus anzutake]|uniref:uncharacterized protein n=1 Tax=Cantharellus anzutake TaxID=1750568 RepID=UPI001907F3ED|nr:uncharacterized protein EI90DRAFT_3063226 [Cantharellus anzutake]KAF8329116.1 hypothetical protein EI90DRAFT_3063226 [Cantharellus anzutake]